MNAKDTIIYTELKIYLQKVFTVFQRYLKRK